MFEHYRNNSRCVCRIAIHISGYDSFFYWMDDGGRDISARMYAGTKVEDKEKYLGRDFYVLGGSFSCVSSI